MFGTLFDILIGLCLTHHTTLELKTAPEFDYLSIHLTGGDLAQVLSEFVNYVDITTKFSAIPTLDGSTLTGYRIVQDWETVAFISIG